MLCYKTKVNWTRDEHGIPQIVADDISELYWGMGYCHAMDRGMQMLMSLATICGMPCSSRVQCTFGL